jgi:hypothetical protein
MPESRVIVYTSSVAFEAATEDPPRDEGDSVLGQAGWAVDGSPIVYVRLVRPAEAIEVDPLEVLIHELLHHARPELTHPELDDLAVQLRASTTDAIIRVQYPIPVQDPAPSFDQPRRELSAWELSEREDAGDAWMNAAWLEANGFPSEGPRRSVLTGRFLRGWHDVPDSHDRPRRWGIPKIASWADAEAWLTHLIDDDTGQTDPTPPKLAAFMRKASDDPTPADPVWETDPTPLTSAELSREREIYPQDYLANDAGLSWGMSR